MACRKCGGCCTSVCFPIDHASLDWAMLHGMRPRLEQGELMVEADLVCRLYDPQRKCCKRYDKRPLACQVYLCDEARQ